MVYLSTSWVKYYKHFYPATPKHDLGATEGFGLVWGPFFPLFSSKLNLRVTFSPSGH